MSHDIQPLSDGVRQTRLKEYALLLPRLLKLVWRLSRDPRVPARSKAMLVFVGGYLVSPVDLLPDFVPGVGHLDDIVLVAFVLDHLINRVPEHIVREHWEGDQDVLAVVREVLDIATGLMPGWVARLFGR